MPHNECLIIENDRGNFEILSRMVESFQLTPVNILEPGEALRRYEQRPSAVVIIDTDEVISALPYDITARLKMLNPECIVVWVTKHKPALLPDLPGTPDLVLLKPFGMLLFQEALVPYLFSKSLAGSRASLN
jgi:CheY-like chemotaxis protein